MLVSKQKFLLHRASEIDAHSLPSHPAKVSQNAPPANNEVKKNYCCRKNSHYLVDTHTIEVALRTTRRSVGVGISGGALLAGQVPHERREAHARGEIRAAFQEIIFARHTSPA